MRIIVCIKQVGTSARIGQDRQLIAEPQAPNALDLVAMEEALRFRSRCAANIVALTVGPSPNDAALRKAVMMGADRAVRVWAPPLKGAGTYRIAEALVHAAQLIGFDLLLCGARSSDTGSELMGALLAHRLNLPLLTRVIGLKPSEKPNRVTAERKLEKGEREAYATALPAVMTVEQSPNMPRYSGPRWVRRLYTTGIELLDTGGTDPATESAPELVSPVEVTLPRPRTKLGVKLTGLTLAQKLALMRGQTDRKKSEGPVKLGPEAAADMIKENLDKWL